MNFSSKWPCKNSYLGLVCVFPYMAPECDCEALWEDMSTLCGGFIVKAFEFWHLNVFNYC